MRSPMSHWVVLRPFVIFFLVSREPLLQPGGDADLVAVCGTTLTSNPQQGWINECPALYSRRAEAPITAEN